MKMKNILTFILVIIPGICCAQLATEISFDKESKDIIFKISNMETDSQIRLRQERHAGDGNSYYRVLFYNKSGEQIKYNRYDNFTNYQFIFFEPKETKVYIRNYKDHLLKYKIKDIYKIIIDGVITYTNMSTRDYKTEFIHKEFIWE